MCISPVGIVNACHPAQAALQAYNLASLIHVHDVGFCQDGAAAMAAAVAEAMSAEGDVASVLDAALRAIIPLSGAEMVGRIERALDLAREVGEYRAFREAVYDRRDAVLCRITCDSRETIPLTLALFLLGEGDVERCVTYAANLGRDADTIASMCGAIAGALGGIEGIKQAWVDKALALALVDQSDLARGLAETALAKYRNEAQARARFERIATARR
jgi:ADP-ribosylglycohydrolase